MSKETRNSGFQRNSPKKSVRKSTPNKDAAAKPRRSKGMIAPRPASAPRSPKGRPENHAENRHGNRSRNQGGNRDSNRSSRSGSRAGSGALWHHPQPSLVIPSQIDALFNVPTSHQGIALRTAPLEWPEIETLTLDKPNPQIVLVLDQITDPHNVGAMLRLASAFGVAAVIMQDRNAPPLGGALAKVAVGCLETVPVHLVTNIANTLESLKKQGWFVTGLAGETTLSVQQAFNGAEKMVVVMGAEGPGKPATNSRAYP